MALNVGELVARLRTDNSEFEQGLDDGEQSFASFGDRLGGLAAAAGAAAAVMFGAALVGAMQAEDVGAKVAASLGQTSAEAGRYGKLAGEIYADNFGQSVAEVGDALSAVLKSGMVDPSDTAAVKAITEQSLTLAQVWGLEVTESMRAASQMVKTGLVPSITAANDLIAAGAAAGLDMSGDLLDTMNEYSTQFRSLGLDAKESLGLISQMVKAGARDTDVAADALKEFLARLQGGDITKANGFKMLGLDARKMSADISAGGQRAHDALGLIFARLNAISDPAAKAQASLALFGTKAEDLQGAVNGLDLSTAATALGNVDGAAQRAADTMANTASAKLETFKRQLTEGLVTVIGGRVIPALESFAGWLQKAGDWISKNKEGVGPLLVFLGTFAGIILAIVAAMKIWTIVTTAYTAVQWALNAAMLANPIGLIIIAVVALVAAILWLWYNSASFRDFLIGMWQAIWGFMKAIGSWFAGPFADFFVSLWQRVCKVFGAIKDFIVGAFNAAVGGVKSAINGMIGLINGVISGINGMISVANKVPGVNLPRLPSIPRLAQGGTVYPSPGGRPVIMGDGGQVEYGVPRDDMRAIIAEAVRAGAGAGGGSEVTIRLKGDGILSGFSRTIRVRGGNVQTATVG